MHWLSSAILTVNIKGLPRILNAHLLRYKMNKIFVYRIWYGTKSCINQITLIVKYVRVHAVHATQTMLHQVLFRGVNTKGMLVKLYHCNKQHMGV